MEQQQDDLQMAKIKTSISADQSVAWRNFFNNEQILLDALNRNISATRSVSSGFRNILDAERKIQAWKDRFTGLILVVAVVAMLSFMIFHFLGLSIVPDYQEQIGNARQELERQKDEIKVSRNEAAAERDALEQRKAEFEQEKARQLQAIDLIKKNSFSNESERRESLRVFNRMYRGAIGFEFRDMGDYYVIIYPEAAKSSEICRAKACSIKLVKKD